MIFLLSDYSELIKDQYGWAALYAFVGFIIVIAVLIVLVLLLMLLSKVLNINLPKKSPAEAVIQSADNPAADSGNEGEIAAVIAAAVSMVMSAELKAAPEEGGALPPPFVIKSIKKI